MINNHYGKLIEALDTLLERERKALLQGDLDEISQVLHCKEKVLDQLSTLSGNAAGTLSPLKDKIARNQVLLEGALRGIREIADRMTTLRRVQKSLETYGSDGQKSVVLTGLGKRVEKRA